MASLCPQLAVLNEVYLELFLGGGIVLAGMVVGFFLFRWLKKRFDPRLGPSEQDGGGGGWTMEQAEDMHESGQISDEEFSVLRRAILGLVGKEEEKHSETPPSDDTIKDSRNEKGSDGSC
jgi:hypothetical protein